MNAILLAVLWGAAIVMAVILTFAIRRFRNEVDTGRRFYLRTGEGLYLTPQGLRRAPMNRKNEVLAPPYDALSWESAGEAQAEMQLYYEMNNVSASTLSKVSLYVEDRES